MHGTDINSKRTDDVMVAAARNQPLRRRFELKARNLHLHRERAANLGTIYGRDEGPARSTTARFNEITVYPPPTAPPMRDVL